MDRMMALALTTIAAVLLTLTLKAAVIALNTCFFYSRPALCRRIYRAYSDRPLRALLVGLVNSLVVLFFILILLNTKPLALVGIGMAVALYTLHLAGRTACYQVMAERISEDAIAPVTPTGWLRGAVVTELSFLVPVVGQLFFLAVTMRCAGACVIALLSQPLMAEAPAPGDGAEES